MQNHIYKILIVDDSTFFRQTTRKMIEGNFQSKIYEASNAFEAMRILGNNPIDIILLDVNMPEVDGFKAAKIIKHQEVYSKIPIIFCTAMPPTREVVQKSFEVGGIDFLNKPFTEQDLVRLLSLYFRFIVRERQITSKILENEAKLKKEIEERREAQKALLESEEKFRKISSSAHDAIIMVNESNQISFWNEAAFRIFSYTSEEVTHIDLVKLISVPGKYQLNKILFDNMKHATRDVYASKTFDMTAIRKGGEQIDLEISLSMVEISGEMNYLIIARNITQRKRVEQNLLKSEAMLADAEATAHIGSWEHIVDSGKTYWSKELYRIYALDQEVITPSIELVVSMLHEDDKEIFRQTIENSISTGESYHIEVRITAADGSMKFVEGRGRAVFNSDSKVERMVGTLMDITDRKNSQLKLEAFLKELEELNATKDKFFSIIAHDLRNPFGAMKNLTEVLNDMYDDFSDEELRELLGEMKGVSNRLFALLENLLTWSRSQRGIIKFTPDDVYMFQLVRGCFELTEDSAKQKNISLTNNVPSDLIISCDHNMITTIVRNLTTNAIKFTPEGGSITADYSESEYGHVISICDSGIGIPEKDLDKLFRIDVSHTTLGTSQEKGTGLGLILCKEFIEKHNGRIWVESKEGIGSTFSFLIPYDMV